MMAATVIEKYVAAALDHGKHTRSGNFRACNRAYDRLIRALGDLRSLPDRGEAMLQELVTHSDESVRVWAATHLLPLQQEMACKTLERVASGSGLVAFSAEMVLKEWRAGRLKIP